MGDGLDINGNPDAPVDLATDPARIIEIAKADAAQLPRMRDQREGWNELAALAEHVTGFLGGRIEERLKDNVAITVYSLNDHATKTQESTELFGVAAGHNATTYDQVIPEVERLNERVDQLDGEITAIDADLAELPSNIAESDRKSVSDVKLGLHEELQEELKYSNATYQAAHGDTAYAPPVYDGAPKWEGPDPEVYPGWSGGGDSGGSGPATGASGHSSPGHSTPADLPGGSTNDPVGGPELQNPGAPAPTPVTPQPTPTPAPPPGGGLPPLPPAAPPAYPPGGSPPPGLKPTPGLPGGAKPTPGMPGAAKPTPGVPGGLKPTPGYPGGKPGAGYPTATKPGAGHPGGKPAQVGNTGPTGSKASRALLPNQRNGTAASTGASPSQRPARSGTTPGRTAPGTGQFGGRTRTTVPSVIGGRGGTAPAAAPKVTGQPGNAGKVFGARANKGKAKPGPKRNGILAKSGTAPKPERSWANAPKTRRNGDVLAGKVIGERHRPDSGAAAAAKQAGERRRRKERQEALAKWRASRNALPNHSLVDGLDGTVVPDVIEAPKQRDNRMSRTDIGPVFGSRGWENGK